MFLTQLTTSVFLTASSLLGTSHSIWPYPPNHTQPWPHGSGELSVSPWLGSVGRPGCCVWEGLSILSLTHIPLIHRCSSHSALPPPFSCLLLHRRVPLFCFCLFTSCCVLAFCLSPYLSCPVSLALSLVIVFFSFSLFLSLCSLFVSGVIGRRIEGCKSVQCSFPSRHRTWWDYGFWGYWIFQHLLPVTLLHFHFSSPLSSFLVQPPGNYSGAAPESTISLIVSCWTWFYNWKFIRIHTSQIVWKVEWLSLSREGIVCGSGTVV